VSWQYLQVKTYNYPDTKPFSGDSLYNPYSRTGNWLKANFHAHSHAWGGITNGKQLPEELVDAYLNYGYDVACVSNYQALSNAIYTKGNIAIPAYEHGLNITKTHQLVIGSNHVTYYNVMLWQNTNTRQYVIERLIKNGGIVVVNHPFMNNGHPEKDFTKLTGYHCLEVINRDRVSDKHWDIALSTGKPSWILANDDCHDVNGDEFLRAWTLVQSTVKDEPAVVDAIKAGRTIGVCRTKMFDDANTDSLKEFIAANKGDLLDSVVADKATVSYFLKQKVKKIILSADNGTIVKTTNDTNRIDFTLTPQQTYLRAKFQTGGIDVYLNPIVRFDGKSVPSNPLIASENWLLTWTLRLLTIVFYIITILLLYPQLRKRIFSRK
jgi:hypothetical protein